MEHRLKIDPKHLRDVANGKKRFEVRRDDRNPPFAAGDTLLLEGYDRTTKRYTGERLCVDVPYVLRGEYCKSGYCIMSVVPPDEAYANSLVELQTELDRVKQERDAAVKDLAVSAHCVTCEKKCGVSESLGKRSNGACGEYQWRGMED